MDKNETQTVEPQPAPSSNVPAWEPLEDYELEARRHLAREYWGE